MGKRLDGLRARLGTYSPLKVAVVATLLGLGIGIVGLSCATAGLEWTNREQFCIGCHEMRDNVYAEYKGSIHDANRSGVRATCPDCHVPHQIGPKLIRKMKASAEVWGAITGKIDTREKFLKHRYELASNEWRSMKATDSRECRNCHSRDGMSQEKQTPTAWSKHQKAKAEGMTCIECHFGIAHNEPEGPGPQELFASEKQAKPDTK
jgi:cytochrome c-type protein NapC